MINDSRKGKLETFSFEAQLGFIQRHAEMAASGGEKLMWLSLAESVKAARDHDLNCPKDKEPFKEGYQRGLADAATVVDLANIPMEGGISALPYRQNKELKTKLAEGIRLFARSDVPATRFLYTVR